MSDSHKRKMTDTALRILLLIASPFLALVASLFSLVVLLIAFPVVILMALWSWTGDVVKKWRDKSTPA